jgi:hypothetical protein
VLVVPPDSLIRHSLVVTEVDQAMIMRETVPAAVEEIRTG